MEICSSQNPTLLWFFRDKGFDDKNINELFRKCKRLQAVERDRASENWSYLKSIGIKDRKIPYIVSKCPKILTLDLKEKIEPIVQCLSAMGRTKPQEVASAIAKFPHILSYSVEEKLCPLLAFFEALGVQENKLGKIILLNPRIISYSIELKLAPTVNFLYNLGLTEEGLIGRVLLKNPFIFGYSVDKRLKPTSEFLKSLGLSQLDLQRVAVDFPEVICRDVNKILRPNFTYLRSCGFNNGQLAALVASYPPILIKSIKNSLEPKIRFLIETMGRNIDEVAHYPDFFRHGLKKRLELRQKLLKQRNINCSLSEMLDCNHKKFLMKFGFV